MRSAVDARLRVPVTSTCSVWEPGASCRPDDALLDQRRAVKIDFLPLPAVDADPGYPACRRDRAHECDRGATEGEGRRPIRRAPLTHMVRRRSAQRPPLEAALVRKRCGRFLESAQHLCRAGRPRAYVVESVP